MDASALESRLQHAFQQGLDLPQDTQYSALEFAKSAHWDSVAHLQLVAAIEEEFGIMMETSDVLGMSSYLKAMEMVKKYGSKRA